MKKITWIFIFLMLLAGIGIVILMMMFANTDILVNQAEIEQTFVRWQYDGERWISYGTPPDCPTPLKISMPVDFKAVTGLLYPGQYRGGDFKPHGGFRFDDSLPGDITVRSPADGHITITAAYLTEHGDEVQYMVDIITPCGIMYRFDHLADLSPKMLIAVNHLPPPKVNDSRGYFLPEPLPVQKGNVLATAVGVGDFNGRPNVFVDFGVYDLSQKNIASNNADWPTNDHGWSELAPYGLCWIDFLEPDSLIDSLKALPTGNEGNDSQYCL